MSENFLTILNIARNNINHNPSLTDKSAEEVARQYLEGLVDEVKEVSAEIKLNNQIYLHDELSDIMWDYACVLASLETKGYIESIEAVIAHAAVKYQERSPAFLAHDEGPWQAVKQQQKVALQAQHYTKYGNEIH